jgi:MFS family permease
MTQRSSFPPVFWVANATEILERFAYYGIYFGFGIYMRDLGLSTDNLANVQAVFLVLSYGIPIFSGSLADRYGFKKLFIASYVAYLPAILMLLVFKSYYGILATMLCIGFAAGIFKPLVASTVRVVTDTTNKTLGFGIFYMMVNIGGFFGPIVSGHLRTRSWDTAHIAGAITIAVMFVLTLVGYREPPRERSTETLASKLRGIATVLTDRKFATFLLLLGIFFWAPFWGFFNICALYIDSNLDTAAIYQFLKPIFDAIPLVGPWALGILSHDDGGVRKVLGESIGNTGLVIILLAGTDLAKLREAPRAAVLHARARHRRRGHGRDRPRHVERGVARPARHRVVRGRGDDHLAAYSGVHHVDRAQGQGWPVHGLELHRDDARRVSQSLSDAGLWPVRRRRPSRGYLVCDGCVACGGRDRAVGVHEGGGGVQRAGGLITRSSARARHATALPHSGVSR